MTPSSQSYPNGWEVRWSTFSYGTVQARNVVSRRRNARDWHKISLGHLREIGIDTPTFSKRSWEVDWDRRKGKRVWARNPQSKMPSARDWHWITELTMKQAGLPWKDGRNPTGKYKDARGYVVLTKKWMMPEDVAIADKFKLFRGRRKSFLKEHQLVAVRKYERSLDGLVVRHLNGIKDDNRPENILIGTSAENTMDHNTARMMAMYWRNKYEEVLRYTTQDVVRGDAINEVLGVLDGKE